MARCRRELTWGLSLVASLSLWGPPLWAQDPVPPSASAATPLTRKALKKQGAENPSPEVENIRKALEALTPDQRKEFRQNFVRWMNLSPEEKGALREQNELRRKQMADEIGAALQQSGLQLDGPRQKAFARRYTQERRQVEEKLRQETEEKRTSMIAGFLAKLRVEFGAPIASP